MLSINVYKLSKFFFAKGIILNEYCLLKKLNSFLFYSFLQWLHFIRANVIQQIYIYIKVTMYVCLSVCLSVQVLKPISQKKPIPFRFRSQEMRGLSVQGHGAGARARQGAQGKGRGSLSDKQGQGQGPARATRAGQGKGRGSLSDKQGQGRAGRCFSYACIYRQTK